MKLFRPEDEGQAAEKGRTRKMTAQALVISIVAHVLFVFSAAYVTVLVVQARQKMMFEGKKSPSIPARKLEHSIRVKQMQKQVRKPQVLQRLVTEAPSKVALPQMPDMKTPDIKNMRDTPLLGARAGSLGETASLLIAAGGLVLLALRIITWHIPVAMIAGVALPALLAHAINPARYLDVASHLLSGGVLLGAFYIATDYVTSPNTKAGQLLFGFGCGFLTYVIRTWGGYPEGMAFAVLLMNAMTPIIDRYIRPRILGRDWRGAPLDPATQKGKS